MQAELDRLRAARVAERDGDGRVLIVADGGADQKVADLRVLRVEQRVEIERADLVRLRRQSLPERVVEFFVEELVQSGAALAREDRPLAVVMNSVEFFAERRRGIRRRRLR